MTARADATPDRFVDPSPWVAAPDPLHPPLAGETSADAIIVGGGYAGLAAALRLRAAGADVVLLEQAFCGAGASGRNAGHLTPTIGKDIYTCLSHWGEQRGLALARFGENAVAEAVRLMDEHAIEADYVAAGNVVAGLHPEHRRVLERSAARAQAAGLDMAFLDEAEMRGRGLPPAFRCGVREPAGGHLHPGKLVLGLRRAAHAAGVRIHEGTPATGLRRERSGRQRVTTPSGAVVAEQALVATNAYVAPDLAGLRRSVLPLEVTLFRTAPLTASQRAALGWRGGEGIYTAHEIMESYRIAPDGRLVGGSKWVRYGAPEQAPVQQADAQKFEALLAERFPEAAPLRIESFWRGWIAATVDHLPLIGERRGLHMISGCNGHGIALCTTLGAATADRMLGRRRDDLEVLRRWLPPLPGEWVRQAAFRAVAAPLERRDARIDRQIRGGEN